MPFYFCHLLFDIFVYFPKRLQRLLQHFGQGLRSLLRRRGSGGYHINWWWLGTILLFAELFGLSEWYEMVNILFKRNTRPLTPREKALAKSVFGDQLLYRRIRIDEKSRIGPRQYRFCYVSFFTINSWGAMRDEVLIHELVHIWQYQQFGAKYIPLALMAQRSPMGYNYGGLEHLLGTIKKSGTILEYNFEQQADIVMDYYLLKNRKEVQWGTAQRTDLSIYTYFVRQINPQLTEY